MDNVYFCKWFLFRSGTPTTTETAGPTSPATVESGGKFWFDISKVFFSCLQNLIFPCNASIPQSRCNLPDTSPSLCLKPPYLHSRVSCFRKRLWDSLKGRGSFIHCCAFFDIVHAFDFFCTTNFIFYLSTFAIQSWFSKEVISTIVSFDKQKIYTFGTHYIYKRLINEWSQNFWIDIVFGALCYLLRTKISSMFVFIVKNVFLCML